MNKFTNLKKCLVISNNLFNDKSPASSIEKSLLERIQEQGVSVTSISSSVGNNAPKTELQTIITREHKSIIYLIGVVGKIIPDIKYLPDATYYSWAFFSKKKAIRIIQDNSIDYIHSFGFANACHWLAYKLKKETKKPWIATFFDSWIDYPTRIFHTTFFKEIDERMERTVAENADIIVHNSENMARIWADRYGKEIAKKIIVISLNCDFSKESPTALRNDNKDVIHITHIGTFYPYRNAKVFIASLNKLVTSQPEYRKRIKVHFVGNVIDSDLSLIQHYGLEDMIDIVGRLSPEECKQYYQKADILLATGGGIGENVMYPSKIMKYFYYDRPILGITPKDSILFEELSESGHSVFRPNEMDNIVSYLIRAFNNYSSICSYNHEYWKQFSLDYITEKYIKVINSLKQ